MKFVLLSEYNMYLSQIHIFIAFSDFFQFFACLLPSVNLLK